MKKRMSRHPYSLMKTIKILSILAVPIIVINIAISIASIANVRQQNIDSIKNSVAIYQESLSSKQNSIEHFIQWTVVNEILLNHIEQANTLGECINDIDTFRTRVNDTQYATGTEYQYFMYLKDKDLFFNASPLQIPYTDYLSIKNQILHLAATNESINNNYAWKSTTLAGQTYMYYMITYNDCIFATYIRVDEMVSALTDINVGKRGTIMISDLDETTVFSSNPSLSKEDYMGNSFLFTPLVFQAKDTKLPFQISFYLDNFSNYGTIMFTQLFVILSTLCICLMLTTYIVFMYRKVIKPIHAFSLSLNIINENSDLINLQSSNIQELEQTNIQFKNLIREIKKLKINIYEQELEKKKFEITFLQNQIRPHFYLNCLTTISSMAQLEQYKDIEAMVLFTSRYLRYLFQTNKETVCLTYELAHIKAYLDILSMRYGPVFQYTCSCDDAYENALIPPLLLFVFVENSVKHNTISTEKLNMTLTIKQIYVAEKSYLSISFSDSGKGFSKEILDKLASKESLIADTGAHIGITNNIQRLNLLYSDDYTITFSNTLTGGALVTLQIPYQLLPEGGSNEHIDCR